MITGDFNASHPMWESHRAVNDFGSKTKALLDTYGLTLKTPRGLATFSNHITTTPTTIDLLLTSNRLAPLVSQPRLQQDIPNYSDHFTLSFNINIQDELPSIESKTIILYKDADYANIIIPHLQQSLRKLQIDYSTQASFQQGIDQFENIIYDNVSLIPTRTFNPRFTAAW